MSIAVQTWDSRDFSRNLPEAMEIYVQAMQYPEHAGEMRAVTARRHTRNEGFACRAAIADQAKLVGFGYGYTSLRGQWWHDLVRRAMPAELAEEWLSDSFELSELHVLPAYQGHGVGRELLLQLVERLPNQGVLLSTPDADTRAFRMYRRLGFVDLARHYMFPGDSRPFAVLGARLPLG